MRQHMTDINMPLNAILDVTSLAQETKESEKPCFYASMRYGKRTQALITAGSKRTRSTLKPNTLGMAHIDIEGARITIEDFMLAKLEGLNLTTSKILQIIILFATSKSTKENQDLSFELSFDYFVECTGETFENRMQKSRFKTVFFKALETISNIKIRMEGELIKGKAITIGNIPLMYYTEVKGKKDTSKITIIKDFVDYLDLVYLMQFYKPILLISDNGAHQFHTKYSYYYNQPKNHVAKEKGRVVQARIFSIQKAIEWTGNLPTLEEVKNSNRAYAKRILDPLDDILSHPHGMIKKWHFCKAKGEVLDQKEIKTFEDIKNLYILVTEVKEEKDIKAKMYSAIGHILERKEKKEAVKTRRANKARKLEEDEQKGV